MCVCVGGGEVTMSFASICEREKENSTHRRFSCHSDNEARICSLILRSNRSRWPRCLKAWVCGRLIAGIALSNPSEGVGVFVRFADSGLCERLITRSE